MLEHPIIIQVDNCQYLHKPSAPANDSSDLINAVLQTLNGASQGQHLVIASTLLNGASTRSVTRYTVDYRSYRQLKRLVNCGHFAQCPVNSDTTLDTINYGVLSSSDYFIVIDLSYVQLSLFTNNKDKYDDLFDIVSSAIRGAIDVNVSEGALCRMAWRNGRFGEVMRRDAIVNSAASHQIFYHLAQLLDVNERDSNVWLDMNGPFDCEGWAATVGPMPVRVNMSMKGKHCDSTMRVLQCEFLRQEFFSGRDAGGNIISLEVQYGRGVGIERFRRHVGGATARRYSEAIDMVNGKGYENIGTKKKKG